MLILGRERNSNSLAISYNMQCWRRQTLPCYPPLTRAREEEEVSDFKENSRTLKNHKWKREEMGGERGPMSWEMDPSWLTATFTHASVFLWAGSLMIRAVGEADCRVTL